jgi:hypothetical protein
MRVGPATQEFAVKGATFLEVAFPNYDGPLTANSDQLRIRYDASAGKYEVFEPATVVWRRIVPDPNATPLGSRWATNGEENNLFFVLLNDPSKTYEESLYSYSALIDWTNINAADHRGVIAFGVPTEASAVPVSGSATFDGNIYGYSTETWDWADWGRGLATVDGTIQLRFDFAAGDLAGSISPQVYANEMHDLPTMNFIQTVFSKGSTDFSGKFDTNLTGANAFSGIFTGPQASELIGNFVFPYKSPEDGITYEAGGGFIAKD